MPQEASGVQNETSWQFISDDFWEQLYTNQNLLSIMQKRLTIIEKSVGNPEKLIALFEKSLPKLEKSLSKAAKPLSTLSKAQKIAACGDNHRQLDNGFNLQNQCYKNFTMQPHLGSYRTEKCYLRQCVANSIYTVLRFSWLPNFRIWLAKSNFWKK